MMANNWYIALRSLAKKDPEAQKLVEQLSKAETEDDKQKAKQSAQEYVQKIQANETEVPEPAPESEDAAKTVPDLPADTETEPEVETVEDEISGKDTQPVNTATEDKSKYDLSAPAFNPRLAKIGINREEELFIKGVVVRKLTRDERILLRRSIAQKKDAYVTTTQENLRKMQEQKRKQAANDPEIQKFHRQRKFVQKIVEALIAHNNLGWIMTNIEGLTPDVMRELLENPANVNAFNAENPEFISNFHKKFGDK